MTQNTKEEKTALRALWRAKREAVPPEERAKRDTLLCKAVTASASYRFADTLLGYAPFGFEIDIMPILRQALSDGRRVALPRTHGGGIMTFHYITSEAELIPGRLGIREPREDAPLLSVTPTTLCLVPGIVFSTRGGRIGYGGGYYDRFLHENPVSTLGIVYREFILPTLPGGRYDRTVTALCTERGILPIQP